MVGGEARTSRVAAEGNVGQELVDCYEAFMAHEPPSLRRRTDKKLSLHACQDVAQEAFLSVARRFQAGDLEECVNVRAYLKTAAWNLARDRLRGERRLELAEDVLRSSAPEQRLDSVANEVDLLEDLVLPAIEAMPGSMRRQVVRLQSHGLTDIEIAAALGVRADRVHRERHKAVVELRTVLVKFIRDQHRNRTRCLKKDR
ncbi:sigma-70 family RNA polymerase sigma factor [Streptomyces sp. NBC_01142]|uniref:RNA polymerase sigma factor n=1 Tax=Streptomyces sp. NBC_01142 TaxID=2975865 RepID=UPI002253D3CC|nr:sigma-70 family RNA polymerase sigma factor [Streptomyces sp. NBC_01142]MCX4826016.1 sigma-70 family RNA polymerase sigma factor [Streptomyces sp. NBC_01142]